MRVCVIGGGASGITAAKYLTASGFECEVLESSSVIGGIWVNTDLSGTDQYGFPFNSPMYRGLR